MTVEEEEEEEDQEEEGIQAQHSGEYVWKGRVAVQGEREVDVEHTHFLSSNFFSKNAEEEGRRVERVASAAA
jgi:predicted secreted protein